MLKNPTIVRAFPFMAGMAAKLGSANGRGGCCGKPKQTVLDYEGLKKAVGQMPPAKQSELKKLLDTQQIRVTFKNARGQKVRQTF